MAEEEKQPVPQVIYTGPNDKRRGLFHNHIYTSPELVPQLKVQAAQDPALAHQFIPLERYKKMAHFRTRGSASPQPRRSTRPLTGPPIKRK